MAILGPVGTRILEAVPQPVEGGGHHVLDLAAPCGAIALAVDAIPVVAHLEDVGALTHAVPNHGEVANVLPGLQVARLELGELEVAGDDHVECAIVGNKDLRVAEVLVGVAIVRPPQHPQSVLAPVLEVGRRGPHHCLVAIAVVASVIEVIDAVLLDAAARSQCSILLFGRRAGGQHLAQRLVVSTVGGGHAPNRVIVERGVVVILLEVEHLEVASLGVVERHGVATTAKRGVVVGLEASLINRVEEGGGAIPILWLIGAITLLAACRRSKQEATQQQSAENILI